MPDVLVTFKNLKLAFADISTYYKPDEANAVLTSITSAVIQKYVSWPKFQDAAIQRRIFYLCLLRLKYLSEIDKTPPDLNAMFFLAIKIHEQQQQLLNYDGTYIQYIPSEENNLKYFRITSIILSPPHRQFIDFNRLKRQLGWLKDTVALFEEQGINFATKKELLARSLRSFCQLWISIYIFNEVEAKDQKDRNVSHAALTTCGLVHRFWTPTTPCYEQIRYALTALAATGFSRYSSCSVLETQQIPAGLDLQVLRYFIGTHESTTAALDSLCTQSTQLFNELQQLSGIVNSTFQALGRSAVYYLIYTSLRGLSGYINDMADQPDIHPAASIALKTGSFVLLLSLPRIMYYSQRISESQSPQPPTLFMDEYVSNYR